MDTPVLSASLLLATIAGWWAWHGLRTDPRRLRNAGRIGLFVGLLAVTSTLAGDPTAATLVVLVMALSPLLALALVAFLLVNGSQMLRKEGRSLGNLLSLLAGVGILTAMALALGLLVWNHSLLPLSVWLALAGGWVALLFFGYVGYGVLYQRLARSSKPDYIVTLGSGLIGDRVPPLLAGRIDGALELYRRERAAGRHPLLVMSGGKGSDEKVAEAVAMGRYALDRGIPAEDLLLEDQSATTEQNLRLTTDVVRADPRLGTEAHGVAVTSNYHAMRAALLASEIGVPVQVVGTRTADYFWPSAMLREFVAVMKGSWPLQVLVFCLVTLPLPLFLAWAMMR